MRNRLFALMLIVALVLVAAAPMFMDRAAAQDTVTLKMGLLPILDVLPFYVAEEAGYFEDAGLDMELIPVSSALERDQLLLAGEIDGMLNDLISTGIFNQDRPRIQIVAMARRAYADAPQFRILAAPGSNITTAADLAGVPIAISENSVIHYIALRILENEGVDAGDLEFIPEPNIPVRFQLLMEGALQAACLPDPLAQAAIEGGAILVADDSALVEQEFSQSVLSFRTEVINDEPEAVQAFVDVWMMAADAINADPDAYRELWMEKTRVPDSVKDTYVLPPFPTYAITGEDAWNDTVEWLLAEDIVDNAPLYEGSVNPMFIGGAAMGDGAMPDGDALNGEAVFAANCMGCHSLDGTAGAGPSVAGMATRAGDTVEDTSARDYLYDALVMPSLYVVEGYADFMPPTYGESLSDAEIDDLIAYLMTLE